MWTQPAGIELGRSDTRPEWPPAYAGTATRTVLDHLRQRYDLAELSRERSVRGQFVRDAWRPGAVLDPDTAQVLLTGLLALDGEEDFEVG